MKKYDPDLKNDWSIFDELLLRHKKIKLKIISEDEKK
jgi:hypothetical protein